jgi:hypothetical protein
MRGINDLSTDDLLVYSAGYRSAAVDQMGLRPNLRMHRYADRVTSRSTRQVACDLLST